MNKKKIWIQLVKRSISLKAKHLNYFKKNQNQKLHKLKTNEKFPYTKKKPEKVIDVFKRKSLSAEKWNVYG